MEGFLEHLLTWGGFLLTGVSLVLLCAHLVCCHIRQIRLDVQYDQEYGPKPERAAAVDQKTKQQS